MLITPFIVAYEGEEEVKIEETQVETVTTTAPKEEEKKATFTQEQVNEMLAKEKRKQVEKQQKQVEELNTIKENFKGTREEKERLESQIEQIRRDSMTAEERSKEDRKKLREITEQEKRALEGDRDLWRERYTDSTIARALTDAAVTERAINVEPILAILRPNTNLAPVMDRETGKETDELVVKVRVRSVNERGEELDLELSPADAVKKMKENTSRYGYLFQGEKNAGIGGSQTGGKESLSDMRNISTADYRKNRKHIMGRG
jgi:hypothetical protein